jgi:hypothetical protein
VPLQAAWIDAVDAAMDELIVCTRSAASTGRINSAVPASYKASAVCASLCCDGCCGSESWKVVANIRQLVN